MTERIRALVVDDEPAARAAIRTLLADDSEIQVVGECADGRTALDAIRSKAPDILFLDVQMPEMDGFTLLGELEPVELPVVVFVTAYDQYALRAFEVHALDYLLKPFDDERFGRAVAHAKQQVRQGKLGALSAIKAGGRVTILGVKDIDWIEAEGDYVKIHAGRAWHVLRETMKHLETQFGPARFVRIHRSTIVNVERIKELQPYFRGEYVVILHDGTSLKLSRGYKEHLETALGRIF